MLTSTENENEKRIRSITKPLAGRPATDKDSRQLTKDDGRTTDGENTSAKRMLSYERADSCLLVVANSYLYRVVRCYSVVDGNVRLRLYSVPEDYPHRSDARLVKSSRQTRECLQIVARVQ